MKYFVTGATGFIGHELVKKLLSDGEWINILVRTTTRLNFPYSEKLSVYTGDLFNEEQIESGMKGCDCVFHLAAWANIWSKNKNTPFGVNVTGTKNILSTALRLGIQRVVFTSSAGVLKPSDQNELIDENSQLPDHYITDYEKTKYQAELLCYEYIRKGLEIVIVCPSKVYGPGVLNKSNSLPKLIKLYLEGRWRFIPGNGKSISNYVYIDDVVDGHILAMKKGISGEKYILGGENASFNQLFRTISEISGIRKKFYRIPSMVFMTVANISLFFADNFGINPLITPAWFKRLTQNRIVSSKKAEEVLNYKITPLETGINKTINWLKNQQV
jgi:nucleoside-diphosphate-sugar epimerase